MIKITGTYKNGRDFTIDEPTRFDAQVCVDDYYVTDLIDRAEWNRLTDSLSEPSTEAAP